MTKSNPAANRCVVGATRARAYIRVSHVGKARQDSLVSDAMQLEEAKRYAAYLGFDFDEDSSKRHADLDVSAFRKPWRDRPGLCEHFKAAQRGEFDALVFYKISRLARNVKEALDMIQAFEELGVTFHFVVERIDSASGHGRFVRNVLLAAAEMQSEDTSDFLKAACERRAREGRLQGGSTPAWIKRDENEKFVVIPEQAEAFKRMVELRIRGKGYVKIAQALNEEGHRTVRGSYWSQGMTYKYLQPTWIQTMLGDGYFGRHCAEPIVILNAYPPIIDHETAEHLLLLQELYSKDYGRKPVGGLDWMISKRRKEGRYSASGHLLSSLVFCPHCGARMVVVTKMGDCNRASPFSYQCPHAAARREIHVKGLNSVSAASLEEAVLRVLRRVLILPPEAQPVHPKVEAIQAPVDLHERIDRLVNLHLDGRIEEKDFKRLYAELLVEREHQERATDLDRVDKQRKLAITLASQTEPTREELRQLVLLLVERIEAPVLVDGITIRPGHKSLRRHASILLKFSNAGGTSFVLEPIYSCRFGRKLYRGR